MKISFKNKFTVHLFHFGVEMLTGYSRPERFCRRHEQRCAAQKVNSRLASGKMKIAESYFTNRL